MKVHRFGSIMVVDLADHRGMAVSRHRFSNGIRRPQTAHSSVKVRPYRTIRFCLPRASPAPAHGIPLAYFLWVGLFPLESGWRPHDGLDLGGYFPE